MMRQTNRQSMYLELGRVGVRINFPNDDFMEKASQHIYVSHIFNGQTIAAIDYIADDSVAGMVSVPCSANAVYIDRQELSPGHQRILLRMFDEFTVVLDVYGNKISIRYPVKAPVRFLLDDVLQAALQPILDSIGGFILHGACMVLDKNAIVLMGNSGSGKSTTAFNLTRFGFYCYADDAVLVSPLQNSLFVWPLSREFSLRPLSFSLFQGQGIDIGPYKRDGDKYYFHQESKKLPGAVLKHICFLNLCGEAQTDILSLTAEETLKLLHQNDRHFSFMNRKDANKYAEILAQKVPFPLSACLGTDLDYQGNFFNRIVSRRDGLSMDMTLSTPVMPTRTQKMSLIRQAWSKPGNEPLAHLIPLLGDFDPSVFKLALGFFQTYPAAGIESIAAPNSSIADGPKYQAPWLRADDWARGCRKLISETRVEVLQRFAFSWIKSAPLVFPFLKMAADDDPERSRLLEDAWHRFLNEQKATESSDQQGVEAHLYNVRAIATCSVSDFDQWRHHSMLNEGQNVNVYCWIAEDINTDWRKIFLRLKAFRDLWSLTVVPVARKRKFLRTSIDVVRMALEYGFNSKIIRQIPLCRLTDEDARFLLDAGAWNTGGSHQKTRRLSFMEPGNKENAFVGNSIFKMPWPEGPYALSQKPFSACGSCGFYSLGLCRGGFYFL